MGRRWPVVVGTAAALLLSLTHKEAVAEVGWHNPERVAAIYVAARDAVTDGCWPRPGATRDAVELVFRQAGIAVVDGPTETHRIPLSQLEAAGASSAVLNVWKNVGQALGQPMEDVPVDFHWFVIEAMGWFTGSACAVSLYVRLLRTETLSDWRPLGDQLEDWRQRMERADLNPDELGEMNVTASNTVTYGTSQVLLTGQKAGMQERVTGAVVEVATGLANAILKARAQR